MTTPWRVTRWLALALGLLLLVGQADRPAYALGRDQLAKCQSGAFSTEEDFIMNRGEPPDGNRWISDGDLLSPAGAVCARNADLTRVFSATGAPLPDLGLDAVDVLAADPERYLVAFSTELDWESRTSFEAGDLLITNGVVIPNVALVAAAFATVNQQPYDVGLDELKFIGKIEDILRFVDEAKSISRDRWLEGPSLLRELLGRYNIDIWYSTEEGAQTPNFTVIFLDGDILSARTGARVVPQHAILSPPVPAGIPDRGVDFGVDAFAVDRFGNRNTLLFSTEIVYFNPDGVLEWTDGDVLRLIPANTVAYRNFDLIGAFGSKARDLGLDALFLVPRNPEDSKITILCDFPTLDFDGGDVAVGDGGTGLYRQDLGLGTPLNPRRPCGAYVPIDGAVPAGATRFRVAYRKAGDPRPAFGVAPGIETEWYVEHRDPSWFNFCYSPSNGADPRVLHLQTSGAPQWMDASDYLEAKLGAPGGFSDGCVNAELRLAVWNSLTAPDPNGHYVVWLEWEDGAGMHQENADHHIQLDNKAPTLTPATNDPIKLEVRLTDGVTVIPACGETPINVSQLQIWGEFDDPYYWYFDLFIAGGNPPASASTGPHNYYDLNDGTLGVKNTNLTGTTPDGSLVRLRDIDLATLLGPSYTKCCYYLQIRVWDASILHSFNHIHVNQVQPHHALQFITFASGATGP